MSATRQRPAEGFLDRLHAELIAELYTDRLAPAASSQVPHRKGLSRRLVGMAAAAAMLAALAVAIVPALVAPEQTTPQALAFQRLPDGRLRLILPRLDDNVPPNATKLIKYLRASGVPVDIRKPALVRRCEQGRASSGPGQLVVTVDGMTAEIVGDHAITRNPKELVVELKGFDPRHPLILQVLCAN
jgi:hypothetical protein